MDLLNLVESLQAGLTNPDYLQQTEALSKLFEGIRLLPLASFTDEHVARLIDFYTSRLVQPDPAIVSTILQSILWLANSQLLNADCAVKICNEGLFINLQIPSLRKSERQLACRLLHELIAADVTRQGLVSLKLSFIRGFISSTEGEKDPECLMSIFSMHKTLLQHFELGPLAEEHFDCMAAYFPVNFTPQQPNLSGISRSDLAGRLEACLFASRHLDGSLLLPLLIEKATSHWTNGRSDALTLLADCLVGLPQAASYLSDLILQISPDNAKPDPIPVAFVSSYLFALCEMIKSLTSQLEFSDCSSDVCQTLTIVAGLASIHKAEMSEIDFAETFFNSLWPDKREGEKAVPEGWFAVPHKALPPPAPQPLVADCLITAALASPNNVLLARLFRRLTEPLLWPKADLLTTPPSSYESKYDQLTNWNSHLCLANRLLSHFSRYRHLTLADLKITENLASSLLFNLSHTLKQCCCDLLLCGPDEQRGLTEIISFSLLCRLLPLLPKTSEDFQDAFLAFCLHVLEHMESQMDEDSHLQALRLEQQVLISKLVSLPAALGEELELSLFRKLQEDSSNVVTEILQRASCSNSDIFMKFFTLLFARCADAVSTSPASQLVSSLLFVIESLRRDVEDHQFLPLLTSLLQSRASNIVDIMNRIVASDLDPLDRSCLTNLLSVIRLVTSSMTEKDQYQFVNFFIEFVKTAKTSSPYTGALLTCAMISALRPTFTGISLRDLADLLNQFFVLSATDPFLRHPILKDVVANEISQCAATFINKFPCEEVIKSILDMLLDLKAETSSFTLTSRFVILTLRALISSPIPAAMERKDLVDRLVSLLLDRSASGLEGLQRCCLVDNVHLLLPITTADDGDKENLFPFNEYELHCHVNNFAVQKCYCLVGLPLRAAWEQLKGVSTLDSPNYCKSTEAFLHGYLRLTSLLPDDIVGDYASDALEASVEAVVSGQYTLCTQALGLSVISRLAEVDDNNPTRTVPPKFAEGFFERLPVLKGACAKAETPSAEVSRLRFHLARCLLVLAGLPPTATARHHRTVRGVLEELLDDDCRSVRIEASRAHNRWCT